MLWPPLEGGIDRPSSMHIVEQQLLGRATCCLVLCKPSSHHFDDPLASSSSRSSSIHLFIRGLLFIMGCVKCVHHSFEPRYASPCLGMADFCVVVPFWLVEMQLAAVIIIIIILILMCAPTQSLYLPSVSPTLHHQRQNQGFDWADSCAAPCPVVPGLVPPALRCPRQVQAV